MLRSRTESSHHQQIPSVNLLVLIVPAGCITGNTERLHLGLLEHSSMPSPHETILCQYHYDTLDRLISQIQTGMPQHQRFYCNRRLVTEIQGAVRHSIFQQEDLLMAQQ